MTNEELILEYRAGNVKALDGLIQQNKGIIYKIAYKYQCGCSSVVDFDDLIQEGYLGLMRAVDKYDPNNENKASFITYSVYWIKAFIYRFIQRRGKSYQDISLYTETGDNIELCDSIADEEDCMCKVEESIYHKELKEEVHQAMYENLTLKQRNVIELRYGFNSIKPMTLQEIGDILDITTSGADNILSASLHKLRKSKWGRMKGNEIRKERYINC